MSFVSNFFFPAVLFSISLRQYLCPWLTIAFYVGFFFLHKFVIPFRQTNCKSIERRRKKRDMCIKGISCVLLSRCCFAENTEDLTNRRKWKGSTEDKREYCVDTYSIHVTSLPLFFSLSPAGSSFLLHFAWHHFSAIAFFFSLSEC